MESIRVIDDGHGLNYEQAESDFSNLGGSWKRKHIKSKGYKRLLHGRLGRGRFRAFAIGQYITWLTRYRCNGVTKEYQIIGKAEDLGHFTLSDPLESHSSSGTEVIINNINKNFTSIRGIGAVNEIACHFALYLRQYPDISIIYDGTRIDASHLESGVYDFEIEENVGLNGSPVKVILTVIEWTQQAERSLYLCDSGGFTLLEIPAGIHARGFNFTAYMKSDFFRELNETGDLQSAELYPPVKQLIEEARNRLRVHFRKRSADEASILVKRWKAQRVYPYEQEPKTPVEEAERQVFDVCALNIHSYLPDFEEGSQRSKQLAFRLLRNALETSPASIQVILGEILELPKQKQEDFAELIQQTSLDSIITASTTVTNRLTFLSGLELLLFDPESKKALLERRQLHRMLAENTWIFGEEFNLTLDDQSLTELLKRHLKLLGKECDVVDEVRRSDGSKGILDLVIGRKIPTPHGDVREHLVIELKRPSYKLNDESLNQIRSYAFTVANDDRFRGVDVKWSFWLISNDMEDSVRRQASQKHLPPWCLHDDSEQNIKIWVKPWGQLITECQGRLKFFQEQLQFRANREDSLEYLRKHYNKYLPEAFQKDEEYSPECEEN